MKAALQVANSLEETALRAAHRAAGYLVSAQAGNGHWCGELTADTTLESDYILFQLWLHPPVNGRWMPPSQPLIEKAQVDFDVTIGGLNAAQLQDALAEPPH
ncbi:MAG: hypothetical protein JO099_02180, partial [Acidobacteriia bacterium]|nr:hypothetical protein [Terriglobia bacterium]